MSMHGLTSSKVEEGVDALFNVLQNDKRRENITSGPEAVFLQIDFIRPFKGSPRIVRVPLEHSALPENAEVCLLVADRIRGRNVDHEITNKHYKKLLQNRGVTEVSKVIPARQIRTEFTQYEAKRKLCGMFDVFLIDNKISSFIIPKMSGAFKKARKWPIPIHMKRKNLKDEISSKLMKSSILLNDDGQTKIIQAGNVQMSASEIADNIIAISNYIVKHFPTGWMNIRALHVKTPKSIAVPIYRSLLSRNDVPEPILEDVHKRPKSPVRGELSILGRDVLVYPDGTVKVCKTKYGGSSSDEEENETIEEKAYITQSTKHKKEKNDAKEESDSDDGGMAEDDVEMEYLLQMEMENDEEKKREKLKKEQNENKSKTKRKHKQSENESQTKRKQKPSEDEPQTKRIKNSSEEKRNKKESVGKYAKEGIDKHSPKIIKKPIQKQKSISTRKLVENPKIIKNKKSDGRENGIKKQEKNSKMIQKNKTKKQKQKRKIEK